MISNLQQIQKTETVFSFVFITITMNIYLKSFAKCHHKVTTFDSLARQVALNVPTKAEQADYKFVIYCCSITENLYWKAKFHSPPETDLSDLSAQTKLFTFSLLLLCLLTCFSDVLSD